MSTPYDERDAGSGQWGNGSGQKLLKLAEKAFGAVERYNAQRTWARISEFMLPSQNREWFGDVYSKGVRRDQRVFDSSPVNYARDLANAFHSTVTNPTMEWTKFRYSDEKFNEDPEALNFMDETARTLHHHLSNSNFDSVMGQLYPSYCTLAQMCLFVDEDLNFYPFHLAEVAIQENDKGWVDRIYRKVMMTRIQCYEKWGDKIGYEEMKQLETAPYEDVMIYHCMYPRDAKEVELNGVGLSMDGTKRPFASVYIMQKTGVVLEEDGFYEQPFFFCRWSKLPGEIYGFGPAHVALADVLSLNEIKKLDLKSLAKAVDPVILSNKSNMFSGHMRPGDLVQVRDVNQIKEMITQARFDVTDSRIAALQTNIKSCFYIDKLMLPPRTETGEMTAYEVQERLSQMQLVLGPTLSRLNIEFLQPLVMRCLHILQRKGELPKTPAKLAASLKSDSRGKAPIDFKILYLNSLARAQQLNEVKNVEQWIQQDIMPMAQMNPSVLDTVDFDQIAEYSGKIREVPEKFIRTDAQVQHVREQRQQQQETAQTMQHLDTGSNIVNNLSQAAQNQGGKQ